SAMLLDQEPGIDHWRVVVICPHRRLNFGRELAVAEFLRERLHWIELESAAADPEAPPLLQGPGAVGGAGGASAGRQCRPPPAGSWNS
ncbi:MAG: hypothetical protein VKN15_04915, partial [Cyanobacteriota bacterium]|nr:hypothetical protein [Cyanobacteriota bacterium]